MTTHTYTTRIPDPLEIKYSKYSDKELKVFGMLGLEARLGMLEKVELPVGDPFYEAFINGARQAEESTGKKLNNYIIKQLAKLVDEDKRQNLDAVKLLGYGIAHSCINFFTTNGEDIFGLL